MTDFSSEQVQGVYQAIFSRRDMRHFNNTPIPEDTLQRCLQAAHHAPSVGYMQPWRIIRVNDAEKRKALHELAETERLKTCEAIAESDEGKKDEFAKLKVQGILDCAEILVVSLMPEREKHVFGRRTIPEMDLASASCAIQNFWLAARVENIGVGWVSFFEKQDVRALFNMPEDAEPIAILCVGYVDKFYDKPMLEEEGWAQRGELSDYVMTDNWDFEKEDRNQKQWS
ncbi:MAG: 5,6-dimethylbenzimidazole synthase [Cellvibrionaceae bacterium]